MASIRRTLSPANHNRSSLPLSNGSFSYKPSTRRFVLHRSLRTPFHKCLFCFFLGFLLGILLFAHIDDHTFRPNDSSVKINPNFQTIVSEQVNFDVVLARKFDFEPKKLDSEPKKLLIVITPTYNRVLQAYYLNRLGQVLKLVNPPILWIVVEMNEQSLETASILRSSGVMYRHLVCKRNMSDFKDRGVHQRNTALEHIQVHKLDGIVYFADDDNIYSLELFERIRDVRRFGTWPVAMLAQNKNKAILEGPVCNRSEVIGWHTNEKSKRLRRFHVDMSGFAFNSTILWDPKRWKRPFPNPIRQLDTVKEGFQETTFIEQLVPEESQMEGVPDGCGEIMNWHLHLDSRGVTYPRGWLLQQGLDVSSADL